MSIGDILTTSDGVPVWDDPGTVIAANGQVLIGPRAGVPAWRKAKAAITAMVSVLTVSGDLLPDWEPLSSATAALFDSNIGAGQTWTVANDAVVPATYSTFTGNQPRARVFQGHPSGAWQTRGFDDSAWTPAPHQSSSTFHPSARTTPPYLPPIGEVDIIYESYEAVWRRTFVPPTIGSIASVKLWMWGIDTSGTFDSGHSETFVNGHLLTGDLSAGVALDPATFDIQVGVENVLSSHRYYASPGDIAVVGSQVWVTARLDGHILRLHPDGSTADWPLLPSPNDITYIAYNSSLDVAWVLQYNWSVVQRYRGDGSSAGANLTGMLPSGSYLPPIAVVGNEFWIVLASYELVKRFNPDGTSAGADISSRRAFSIGFDGTHVWVGRYGDAAGIDRYDTSGTFIDHLATTGIGTTGPEGIGVVGSEMWARSSNFVDRFDIATGTWLGSFHGGDFGGQLAVVGSHVWFAKVYSDHAAIQVYDPTTPVQGAIPDIPLSEPLAYRIAITYAALDCLVWIGNDFDSTNTFVRLQPDGSAYHLGPMSDGSRVGGMAVVGTQLWIVGPVTLTRITRDGNFVTTPYSLPSAAGTPRAIIDTGSEVWISNYDLSRAVGRYDYDGNLLGSFNDSTLVGSQGAMAVVNGQIWITNWGFNSSGNTITRLHPDRTSAGPAISGNGLGGPYGIAVVGASVWTCQRFLICRFLAVDGTPDPAGNIDIDYYATGIAVVDGEVWVLDNFSNSVHRYDFNGTLLGTVTSPSFSDPVAIVYPFCINPFRALPLPNTLYVIGSQIWIGDKSNAQILRLNSDGTEAGPPIPFFHDVSLFTWRMAYIPDLDLVGILDVDGVYLYHTDGTSAGTIAPLGTFPNFDGWRCGIMAVGHEFWVSCSRGSFLTVRLNPDGSSAGGNIPVSFYDGFITGGLVYLVDFSTTRIHMFDFAGSAAGSIPGNGGGFHDISTVLVGSEIWTLTYPGTVARYTLAGAFVGGFQVSVPYVGTGSALGGIGVVGSELWLTCNGSSVNQTTPVRTIHRIPLSPAPTGVSPVENVPNIDLWNFIQPAIPPVTITIINSTPFTDCYNNGVSTICMLSVIGTRVGKGVQVVATWDRELSGSGFGSLTLADTLGLLDFAPTTTHGTSITAYVESVHGVTTEFSVSVGGHQFSNTVSVTWS